MASDTGIGKFLLSITFRLMLFNIILVFLPAASILYLDTYEKQLLTAQEKSMVQQGRLLSAALSESGDLNADRAKKILINLQERTEARLRILDHEGILVADSSSIIKSKLEADNLKYSNYSRLITTNNKSSILYRTATLPIRIYRKFFQPPLPVEVESYYNSTEPFTGSEVMDALDGRYGAVTRLSSDGQRSVSLYIAIPILNTETVIGAVLCSQSTYRILQNLYEIRLILLQIFLWSFLFALIISVILAYSISFRIKRLRNEAESIRTGRGRLEGYFTPSIFMDEIGDLSYSLADLAHRMDKNFRHTTSFIQDFSHEFKNPLSVVRTASEMIPDSTGEQQNRFLELIDQNSRRMEYLLDSIMELSLIDKDLEEEIKEEVDINILLANLIPGFQIKYPEREWKIEGTLTYSNVYGTRNKLERVFINILENANSFSSSKTPIKIHLEDSSNQIKITIINHGSTIPTGDLSRIFDRFYSNRVSREQKHNGLGLSISRTIVQSYKGSIKAENIDNGVKFSIYLPI